MVRGEARDSGERFEFTVARYEVECETLICARFSVVLIVLLGLLLGPYRVLAQSQPPNDIPSDEAEKHLVENVEPPTASATRVGGTVAAEIVVATDGTVESVKITTGPAMLQQSAADTIKQWKFSPFVKDGRPIQVRTRVAVFFPGGMSKDELTARKAYFPLEDKCRMLVNLQSNSQAEKTCSDAVELSNELPPDAVLERSTALSLLGHALLLQGKAQEALPRYAEALALTEKVLKADDADLATNYVNLGRAYFRLGELQKADRLYGRAVATFEAAIASLPAMKENNTRRLKRTLMEYSQVKRAMGEFDAAEGLEKKAGAL